MKTLVRQIQKHIRAQFHWIRFFVLGYAMIFLVSQIFYGSQLFSAVSGIAIFLLANRHVRHREENRKRMLRNQFKDLLYSLAASFATGRQLPTALQDAYTNLGYLYHEETPMLIELKHMTKAIAENQESEESILLGFAMRSGVEDIRNFVDVYLSCRGTGGDLNQVIANASEILMEKMAIEQEIKVMTSQKQFEGKIITAMPIIIILFLNLVSPDYLVKLYQSIEGRLIMTLALLGILSAYWLTERITNIQG